MCRIGHIVVGSNHSELAEVLRGWSWLVLEVLVSISMWPCLVKYLGRTSDSIVYRARPVVIVLVLV